MVRTIFMVASLFLADQLAAQDLHPYLKNFNLTASNGQLYLSWTTRPGFTCQDIHIELSKDSTNFNRVGTYFGLCGDTAEKHYTFIIEEPHFNTINYVRLELGNFGYSFVEAARVIKPSSELLVVPHPANRASVFYFTNDNKNLATINFYNLSGKLVRSVQTEGNSFGFGDLTCEDGIFTYTIEVDNSIKRGKILVSCL